MHLVVLGLNHNTAPVELREAVAIFDHELPDALMQLSDLAFVQEALVLSTCNRTEIYCIAESAGRHGSSSESLQEELVEFLISFRGVCSKRLDGHLYFYEDREAAAHLMTVAAGMDSLVLGEYQILSQVKAAYAAAQAAASVGAQLNQLFQSALAVAKKVRTETQIGRGIFSVGSAAVELARQIFGDTLQGRAVLILGAGKMSDVTARHLQAHGASTIFVANRTYQRAAQLAAQLGAGAQARSFDDLPALLLSSDIVICSTAAPHPVVTRKLLEANMRIRRNRPLFLIDIAVPRDVEATAAELDDVYLFNIDDLRQVVEHARSERAREIESAQKIVAAAVDEYLTWRRSLEVAPMIVAMRKRFEALRREELAKLRARLPDMDERELQAVDAAMSAYSNKLAHNAIMAIKESAQTPPEQASERLDALRTAFGIETSPAEKGSGE